MTQFRANKVVSALPGTLDPDTLYLVRTGAGFDFYCSDATGGVAHKLNSSAGVVPVGTVLQHAGASAPPGYLVCDGSVVSIAAYPALYAAIGSTWGGNGSTTFGLPDLRGRMPTGASGAHALGSTGGSASVTLTVGQMPAHTHSSQMQVQSTGIAGQFMPTATYKYLGGGVNTGLPSAAIWYDVLSTAVIAGNPINSNSVGSGDPVDITPPFAALNFIIYAGA